MKRSTNINQILALFIALFVVTAFSACSDVAGPDNNSDIISGEYDRQSNLLDALEDELNIIQCGGGTLWAGQDENAGNVSIESNDGILTVTYNSKDGWGISETHLWIGTSLEDGMPAAGNGAPKNGHFPYGDSYNPATSSTSYFIDLAEYGINEGDEFYVVAHAVTGELRNGTLRKTETAYAGDNKGKSKRWFYYMTVKCEPGLTSDDTNAGVDNGK